jgi:glutamate carboxypeptidase
MARILAAFHDSLSNDPPLTFNPGVIVGGTTVTFDAVQNRGTAWEDERRMKAPTWPETCGR